MSMTLILLLCSLGFLFIHVGISGTKARGKIISAIGEGPYMGIFSLLSLGFLGGMAYSFNRAVYETTPLWNFQPTISWVSFVLMLPALILATCGLMGSNPTSTFQAGALEKGATSAGMTRVTRHPFLMGVALWSLLHMLSNGDTVSLILFGAIFLVCALGAPTIDGKMKARAPEQWQAFSAETSIIPFAAIIGGRNSLKIGEIGWLPILIAVVIWLALGHFHGFIFGVPALPIG